MSYLLDDLVEFEKTANESMISRYKAIDWKNDLTGEKKKIKQKLLASGVAAGVAGAALIQQMIQQSRDAADTEFFTRRPSGGKYRGNPMIATGGMLGTGAGMLSLERQLQKAEKLDGIKRKPYTPPKKQPLTLKGVGRAALLGPSYALYKDEQDQEKTADTKIRDEDGNTWTIKGKDSDKTAEKYLGKYQKVGSSAEIIKREKTAARESPDEEKKRKQKRMNIVGGVGSVIGLGAGIDQLRRSGKHKAIAKDFIQKAQEATTHAENSRTKAQWSKELSQAFDGHYKDLNEKFKKNPYNPNAEALLRDKKERHETDQAAHTSNAEALDRDIKHYNENSKDSARKSKKHLIGAGIGLAIPAAFAGYKLRQHYKHRKQERENNKER